MRIRAAVLALALLALVGVTVVTYTEMGTFLFNRGSDIFTIKRLSMVTMLIVTLLVLIPPALTLRARSSVPFAVSLLAAFVVWTLCGRAIGISWDARIAGGWLCFRTNTIELLEKGDGEDYARRWQVATLPGWRLELRRSSGRTERLFVGPVLLPQSLALLAEWEFKVAGRESGASPSISPPR